MKIFLFVILLFNMIMCYTICMSKYDELLANARYNANISVKSLSETYDIPVWTVRRLLKKNNLYDERRWKYSVNHNFLDELTPESEYFCGIIASDGWLTTDNNSKYIGIKQKEGEFIQKIKTLVVNNNVLKLSYYKKKTVGNAYTFVFSSPRIFDRLNSFGITERKSKSLFITNARLVNSTHFWRGMYDGDGSFMLAKDGSPRIQLASGSEFIKNNLSDFLQKNIDPSAYLSRSRHMYRFFRKHTARQFIEKVYLNAPAHIRHDRKYDAALKLYKNIGK